MRALLLCAGLCACGSTGGNVVTFDVAAKSANGARAFDTSAGWHVELASAHLHVGAVYLNLSVPISGSQETNCILPGVYTAQELAPLDVDELSTAAQPFPQPATGTDDEARTAEVWLTGGDINADADPTPIATLAGTATRGADPAVPFTATVTIATTNRGIPASDASQPSQHPICKQRIVSPIPIDLTPTDGGTLVVAIDPAPWLATIDFFTLPPSGEIPDSNTDTAGQALFSGLRAAAASFQLWSHDSQGDPPSTAVFRARPFRRCSSPPRAAPAAAVNRNRRSAITSAAWARSRTSTSRAIRAATAS